MTAVEWLFEQLPTLDKRDPYYSSIFKQAEQMEKDKEYETKAYWFGRGILAGRENRIEELQPKQTEQALQLLADQAQELNMGYETEISDEELEKLVELEYPYDELASTELKGLIVSAERAAWVEGIKWYREQIKKK